MDNDLYKHLQGRDFSRTYGNIRYKLIHFRLSYQLTFIIENYMLLGGKTDGRTGISHWNEIGRREVYVTQARQYV